MARNFKPNEAGIRALLVGEELRHVLRQIAEKGKAYAETIAPYDAGDETWDHLHYKNSFDVLNETVEWRGRWRGLRAAVQLYNWAPYAAAVEYGYEGRAAEHKVSAHRVLGRTLDYLESEGKL